MLHLSLSLSLSLSVGRYTRLGETVLLCVWQRPRLALPCSTPLRRSHLFGRMFTLDACLVGVKLLLDRSSGKSDGCKVPPFFVGTTTFARELRLKCKPTGVEAACLPFQMVHEITLKYRSLTFKHYNRCVLWLKRDPDQATAPEMLTRAASTDPERRCYSLPVCCKCLHRVGMCRPRISRKVRSETFAFLF